MTREAGGLRSLGAGIWIVSHARTTSTSYLLDCLFLSVGEGGAGTAASYYRGRQNTDGMASGIALSTIQADDDEDDE